MVKVDNYLIRNTLVLRFVLLEAGTLLPPSYAFNIAGFMVSMPVDESYVITGSTYVERAMFPGAPPLFADTCPPVTV